MRIAKNVQWSHVFTVTKAETWMGDLACKDILLYFQMSCHILGLEVLDERFHRQPNQSAPMMFLASQQNPQLVPFNEEHMTDAEEVFILLLPDKH